MLSPPRQSSPPSVPFGHAPSSGVISSKPIPDIPSSSGPSEPVLETITSPIRGDDTSGGSFHESPTSSPTVGVAEEPLTLTSLLALFPTCLQRITTLEAKLKATKILHRDIVVLFARRIKKLESKLKTKKRKSVLSDSENEEEARQSQELEALLNLVNAALHEPIDSAGELDSAGRVDSAVGRDSAGRVVSAGGVDSTDGLISVGVSVAAGPTVPAEPSSPIRDPSKGKAAELDRVALNLTNEEWIGLVDQVWANPTLSAELLRANVSEDTFSIRMVDLMNKRSKAIDEIKAKAKREKPMTPAQHKEFIRTFIVYDKILRAVDLAIAKDHHQHLKRSGETLESLELKKLKSSHSTEQPAESQETTYVSAGATIAAGDPILGVTSVSAASSIPAGTPIAAGVSTTAGAFRSASEASVLIIEPLDSPPKDTSLPLDPKTEEQDVHLRKSSRKKSIARRRTLPSPSKSEYAALPFDEDNPEAEFKKTLITAREYRDAFIIWDVQDQWEIRSWRFYALPAIHVLETEAGDIIYMFVDKKLLAVLFIRSDGH
nr:hypothetical protein [Tanacetum cinerariifolium]